MAHAFGDGRPIANSPRDIEVRPVTSPFDVIPSAQISRWLEVMSSDPDQKLKTELDRLEELILSTDPVLLLSCMSIYHLFHEPGLNLELTFADPLLQFHLEWLQAFCLRFPFSAYARPAHMNAVLNEITESIKKIPLISVYERWHRDMKQRGQDPHGATGDTWLQELARIERLAVRNWAYSDQMMDTVSQMCATMDDWATSEFGFPLSALPHLMQGIVEEVEARSNRDRRAAMSAFQQSESPTDFARRWQESELPGTSQVPDLLRKLEEGQIGRIELVHAFVQSLETGFPSFFDFAPADLARLSDGVLNEKQGNALLAALSYGFGDVANKPINHLTLGNPTWTRPFIQLENGHYSCPVPGMLLSHCLDIVESLVIVRDADLWWSTRSDYLERQSSALFQAAFPNATHFARSKWTDPSDGVTVYENDLATVLGDVVVIAEAKAHRVPAEVRRGAPDALRESIVKLVVEPSEQSARFAHSLLDQPGPRPFFNDTSGAFSIDSSVLKTTVRLNIVLDSFSVAGSSTASLRSAGILHPDEPNPAPTMLLTDLQSVLILLPDELQRLHYLARRQIIQDQARYHGDEIDLLSLYIETGFNTPDLELSPEDIFLRGLSKPIDAYLEPLYAGHRPGALPSRPIHPWYARVLGNLQFQRPKGWASMSMTLLDATPQAQQEMLRRTKQATMEVLDVREIALATWTMELGLSMWKSVVVGVAHKGYPAESIDEAVLAEVVALRRDPEIPYVVMQFDPLSSRTQPTAFTLFEAT